MEAISALSVAASAVQFVAFASHVVHNISDLVSSGTSELKEHARLRQDANKLVALSENIQKVLEPSGLGRELTPLEATVQDVCEECKEKATALLKVLAS